MTIVLRVDTKIEIYDDAQGLIKTTIMYIDKKKEYIIVSQSVVGGTRYCVCRLNAQGRYQKVTTWRIKLSTVERALKNFMLRPWP
jgi:hypothetical protein